MACTHDPKYAGHISMWDDGPSAVSVSSYIHGWDETKITPDQLAQIKQEWIDQRKLNLTYWLANLNWTKRWRVVMCGWPMPGRARMPPYWARECLLLMPTPKKSAIPGWESMAFAKEQRITILL